MAVELKIPSVGESITEVQIGRWHKSEGEAVAKDEDVVSIESEKATVDLPSPEDGTLGRILKKEGEAVKVGTVIARIETDSRPATKDKKPSPKKSKVEKEEPQEKEREEDRGEAREEPATKAEPERDSAKTQWAEKGEEKPSKAARVMPAARRLLEENDLRAENVKPTGPGGRLLKEDVLRHLDQAETPKGGRAAGREEEAVPMTPLRRTVARRLVEAQQSMAMLTTFNEIDMSAVMALRKEYQEAFQKKYDAKLGFMSFFVKAAIDALKSIPQLNASIRDDSIVFHNYYDVGVAIGGARGLVVPVIRNAERLSFAGVELAIADLANRARDNKLAPEELQGGTFTITNGGVYGSLLSTPIVNPPQSGILGMHAIQERPVAHEGNVVIRPIMNVALSYDHRIVDGREAVTFLRRVKEVIEKPARMLIEV